MICSTTRIISGVAEGADGAGGGVCLMCHQSIVAKTPSPNKRSRQTISSQKKKLRSGTPTGNARVWVPGLPVYINVHDGNGGRGWEAGHVFKVIDHHDGRYDIVVQVKDDETNQWHIPRTINSYNQDPIPNENPSDPNYNLCNYITTQNECLDGLPEAIIKQYRCMKYHIGTAVDASDILKQDVVGESLLDEDPAASMSIRNLMCSLMTNENVKRIVKIATGEEQCTVQNALAHFIGQLCGIELNESSSSNNEIDPKGVLDQIGSTTNRNINCPLSQVFLVSAMSARTRKAKGFDPNASLYDARSRGVFANTEKLRVRRSRLRTALAAIRSSQTNKPSVSEDAGSALLEHGIRLMIDMRGTSDRLLDSLAEEGICRPAKVIRNWIQKLAEAVEPLNSRSPPLSKDETHILCHTGDNADFHLFE